jgi:hypothetical protein
MWQFEMSELACFGSHLHSRAEGKKDRSKNGTFEDRNEEQISLTFKNIIQNTSLRARAPSTSQLSKGLRQQRNPCRNNRESITD